MAMDIQVTPSAPVNPGKADLIANIDRLRAKSKNGMMDVEVGVVVQNQGNASTVTAFTVSAYFSGDTSLSADDVLLQNWDVNALVPADAATLKTRNSLPSASGFIIIEVDANMQVDETDKTNNRFSTPL